MELFPYCWIQSGSPLLPWWLSDKESACSIGDEFWSLGRKDPRKKEMATHSSILFFFFPVFLPGKSCGQMSLVGYSPWDHKSWTRLRDYTTTSTESKSSVLALYFLVLMDIYLGQIFAGGKQCTFTLKLKKNSVELNADSGFLRGQ